MTALIACAALLGFHLQSDPPAEPAPKAPPRNQKTITGKASPGAKLAFRWKASPALTPVGETFTADAEGNFTATVIFNKRPIALVAVDAEQKRGGLIILDEKNIDAPATIAMEPLVTVKGEVRCPELEKLPDGIEVGVSASSINFLTATPTAGKFSFPLPPGEYMVHARGSITMVIPASQKVTLKEETDLGFLDLKLTPLGQHQGKEPPAWSVTAARGVEKTVKLSDYKGKWLLIEFWGFW